MKFRIRVEFFKDSERCVTWEASVRMTKVMLNSQFTPVRRAQQQETKLYS
jgi:hypothetical protein